MHTFKQTSLDFQKILLGTITEHIDCRYAYNEVISFLTEDANYYNYLIPKVNSLTSYQRREIVKRLQEKGIPIYVHENLVDTYKDFLKNFNLLGTDVYLVMNDTKGEKALQLEENFAIDTKYSIGEVIKLLTECFGGWKSEPLYCKLFEESKNNGLEDRIFETFVIREIDYNQIVAAGSIVIDKSLNLAYLHNSGVHENYRRMGLHTALINARVNLGIENGINKFLAITEENGASYHSYKKNGFKVYDKFYFYKLP